MKILRKAIILCLYTIPAFAQMTPTVSPPVTKAVTPLTPSPEVPTTAIPPTTGVPTNPIFANMKDQLLGRADARINALQKQEQCIRAAADQRALNACTIVAAP